MIFHLLGQLVVTIDSGDIWGYDPFPDGTYHQYIFVKWMDTSNSHKNLREAIRNSGKPFLSVSWNNNTISLKPYHKTWRRRRKSDMHRAGATLMTLLCTLGWLFPMFDEGQLLDDWYRNRTCAIDWVWNRRRWFLCISIDIELANERLCSTCICSISKRELSRKTSFQYGNHLKWLSFRQALDSAIIWK